MNNQNESISMTSEPLSDRSFDMTLGVVIMFLITGPIGLVVWSLFTLIDSSFLSLKNKEGRVIDKIITPEFMGQGAAFNNLIETASPQLTYYPKEWSLSIEVDGKKDTITVTEDFYNSITEGDLLMTECKNGRFSGGLYLKALSKI